MELELLKFIQFLGFYLGAGGGGMCIQLFPLGRLRLSAFLEALLTNSWFVQNT